MSASKQKRKNSFRLPPHANAAVHAEIMKRLSKMTVDEVFETAVKAGIYTKSGRLRKPYRPEPDDPS